MAGKEIPAHVYARIAEDVSRAFGVDLDAHAIQDVVEDHARYPMREDIEEAIMKEAKEYGLVD